MDKYIIVFKRFDLASKTRVITTLICLGATLAVMVSGYNAYLNLIVIAPLMLLSAVCAFIAFERGCVCLRMRDESTASVVDDLIRNRF